MWSQPWSSSGQRYFNIHSCMCSYHTVIRCLSCGWYPVSAPSTALQFLRCRPCSMCRSTVLYVWSRHVLRQHDGALSTNTSPCSPTRQVTALLVKLRLGHGAVRVEGTPRRLAVMVEGLAAVQAAVEEQVTN